MIDSGPGVNKADQDRIFERFYQADKSRQGSSKKGVGLGLSIARQIVLSHGGKIWIESSPGFGSDFVVKLPVSLPDDVISNTKKVVS
jgi:signal transduction histidine kinase